MVQRGAELFGIDLKAFADRMIPGHMPTRGQNVSAGDFDALVDAIASKTAYANVHTTGLPLGEIRGQCRSERREYQEQR